MYYVLIFQMSVLTRLHFVGFSAIFLRFWRNWWRCQIRDALCKIL